jgi:hypothetical protein
MPAPFRDPYSRLLLLLHAPALSWLRVMSEEAAGSMCIHAWFAIVQTTDVQSSLTAVAALQIARSHRGLPFGVAYDA